MFCQAELYSVLAVLQVTESVKMWCALMLKNFNLLLQKLQLDLHEPPTQQVRHL